MDCNGLTENLDSSHSQADLDFEGFENPLKMGRYNKRSKHSAIKRTVTTQALLFKSNEKKVHSSIRSQKGVPKSQFRTKRSECLDEPGNHSQNTKKEGREGSSLEKDRTSSNRSVSIYSYKSAVHQHKSIFSKSPYIKSNSKIMDESFEVIEIDDSYENTNSKPSEIDQISERGTPEHFGGEREVGPIDEKHSAKIRFQSQSQRKEVPINLINLEEDEDSLSLSNKKSKFYNFKFQGKLQGAVEGPIYQESKKLACNDFKVNQEKYLNLPVSLVKKDEKNQGSEQLEESNSLKRIDVTDNSLNKCENQSSNCQKNSLGSSKPTSSRKNSMMPQLPIDPFQFSLRPRKIEAEPTQGHQTVLRRNSEPKLSITQNGLNIKSLISKNKNVQIASSRTIHTHDLSRNKRIFKLRKPKNSKGSTRELLRTETQKVEIQDRRIAGVFLRQGTQNKIQKFGSGNNTMNQRVRKLKNKNALSGGEYRVMGDRIFKFTRKE